jgi:hypothetical protein
MTLEKNAVFHKPSREERLEEHRKRNCLFCDPQFRTNEDYRLLRVKNKEACFAVLDKNPKVLGHSLVISEAPFDDLTDSIAGIGENEKTLVFESAVELAKRIEIVLGAEKVYIMLMCEKWNLWETSGYVTLHPFFRVRMRSR